MFRSYEHAELELPPEGALFVGANGVGKTNFLEAIHYLYTGRSQRNASKSDVIRRGSPVASVSGTLRGPDDPYDLRISYRINRQSPTVVTLNGKRLTSLSEWFGHGTIVSFGPEDIELVHGSPADRRRYIDMLVSQVDPTYLLALISYRRNLAHRNSLLQRGRPSEEFEVYEQRLSVDGALIFTARAHHFACLAQAFGSFYEQISSAGERAEIAYRPSVPCVDGTREQWKNVFYNTLKEQRKRDFSLGYSSLGPHRDDLRCTIGGLPARTHASQGQSRSIALALRLAALECLRSAKGGELTVLVDDAFAGLDAGRRERMYPLVKGKGRLFVTAHSADIPQLGDLSSYLVKNGTVSPL